MRMSIRLSARIQLMFLRTPNKYRFRMTIIFQTQFDSGDFSDFSGTSVDRGENLISQISPYIGQYHATFRTFNTPEYAQARGKYVIGDIAEVYTRGYFAIVEGLPLPAEDDRFVLMSVEAGLQIRAWVGIRKFNGVDRWFLMYVDAVGWNYVYGDPVQMGVYYLVELHWSPTLAELFVNQSLQAQYLSNIQVTADTARFGVTAKAVGSSYSLMVYGDAIAIGDSYIGPIIPPEKVTFEYSAIDRETLESLNIDANINGTLVPSGSSIEFDQGSIVNIEVPTQVETQIATYLFSHYLVNGEAMGTPTISITIQADTNVQAVYTPQVAKVILNYNSSPIMVDALVNGTILVSGSYIELDQGSVITISVPKEVEVP